MGFKLWVLEYVGDWFEASLDKLEKRFLRLQYKG